MTDPAIIAKIKKCLALAKSSNEHEAAAAMRQAQALMQKHGVTDFDIETADIGEANAKAGATSKPVAWEARLAGVVADTFGCELMFSSGKFLRPQRGIWNFIGHGPAPEVARYAFEVLFRQIKLARLQHIKTALKRCGPTSRTRRADLYCDGWVGTVAGLIDKFAGSAAASAAVAGYIERKYTTSPLQPTNRSAGRRNLSEREYGDYAAGRRAGNDAQLHRGVGGVGERAALR